MTNTSSSTMRLISPRTTTMASTTAATAAAAVAAAAAAAVALDGAIDSASNHSDTTPIPETEPRMLGLSVLSPPSPNSIEQFPDQQPQKATLKLSSSVVKCSLPSVTTDPTTRPPKQSVRFSPLVRVKDTLSHRDMSLKEHFDYWIQDHEFLMIKQRNQNTIKVVEESGRHEDFGQNPHTSKIVLEHLPSNEHEEEQQQHCLRGLESGLRNENLRKRSYRFAALEEVFLEQEDQYYAGIYDDEAIAEIYFEVTAECRFRAEFRALLDRKEILDYLGEGVGIGVVLPVVVPPVPQQHQDEPPPTEDDEDCDEFAI